MGYYNSKGKPFSQTTLAKFLTNPRYKGYYTAKLTEVEDYKTHKKKKLPKEQQIIYKDDKIPAIVSEELWEKANLLHEKRKKLPSRHVLNSDEHIKRYKYSCKLYCKDCGAVFIRNGGSNRSNDPVWTCKTCKNEGVKTCASPNIKEPHLDKIFIDLFTDFIKNKKEYIKLVNEEYRNIMEKSISSLNLEEMENKIKQIEMQKDKLLDLSIKGMIDDFEFKKRNDKFNVEIFNIQKEIDNQNNREGENERLNKKLEMIESCLNTKLDIRENLPYLINLLIQKVEVEKINGDRKNIRLKIFYDFNAPDIDIEMDLNNKSYEKNIQEIGNKNMACSRYSLVKKCSCVDTKQSRVCRFRFKIR